MKILGLKKILQKFDITKMISNHKFNETRNLQKVIEILKDNKIVSIVSDAGTQQFQIRKNIGKRMY